MSIDFKKALNIPFCDTNWMQKMLIAGIISIIAQIPSQVFNFVSDYQKHNKAEFSQFVSTHAAEVIFLFLILFAVSLVFSSISSGYILQSVHNQIFNEEPVLPDWESRFKDYFKKGLIYLGISILYGLIISAVFLVFFILFLVLFNGSARIAFLPSIIILILSAIIYGFIEPFIRIYFAKSFNFKDSFKIKSILKDISKAGYDYFIAVMIAVGATIVFFMANFVIVIITCCIGVFIIPFFTVPFRLIILNLFVQAYKQALSRS